MKKWHKIIDFLTSFEVSQKFTTAYILVKPNEVQIVTDRSTKPKTGKEILKRMTQKISKQNSQNTNEQKKVIVRKKVDTQKNKFCPVCEYTHHSSYTLNVHLKHCNKKYCSYCDSVVNKKQYGIHLKKYHNINSFQCSICCISFESREKFLNHKSQHENYKYSCLECKLSFKNVNKLTTHLNKSHKTVFCNNCNKTFPNQYCFNFHAKSCKQKESDAQFNRFICDLCRNEFKTRIGIQTHMLKVHLGVMTFTCDKCGKQFMSDCALEEHMESHDKILNRYVCQFCGAKYSTSGGHRKHMRNKHYRVDPELYKKTVYPCTKCKKVLSSKKFLANHLSIKHGTNSA